MKQVELYAKVRYAVRIEGLSKRAAARRFGIRSADRRQDDGILCAAGLPALEAAGEAEAGPVHCDHRWHFGRGQRPAEEEQHTSKRIFERLRGEHGFTGGLTIVKDYVAGWRQRGHEMFVPLVHRPGHAQVDFGEAIGIIGGVERKIHFFAFDLPHSDACFVVAYPAETTEAFCDGHVRAFAFFGGVRGRFCMTTPSWRWRGFGGRQAAAHARICRAAIALSVRGPVRTKSRPNRTAHCRQTGGRLVCQAARCKRL